jgi:glutamate racemase
VTDSRPIGVFDSGVGGLTVLREILRRTPGESTVYLGDNARAPYGTRTDEEVRAFSAEALDVLADRDVKAIVVACNTSTAVALGDLRRRYDLPILGVIRPGAVAATLTTRERRVGVIATPATIRSHAYFSAIKEENPAVEVYEHATPALVPMVEAGNLAGPEVEATVREALAPLLGDRTLGGEFIFPLPPSARIDTLLLGCTHYPLLGPVIAEVVGPRIAIVDSATATSSALAELLGINGLEAPGSGGRTSATTGAGEALAAPGPGRDGDAADGAGPATPDQPSRPGALPWHVQLTTGDVEAFRTVAERLFGEAFPDVEEIELGRPAGLAVRGTR